MNKSVERMIVWRGREAKSGRFNRMDQSYRKKIDPQHTAVISAFGNDYSLFHSDTMRKIHLASRYPHVGHLRILIKHRKKRPKSRLFLCLSLAYSIV